MELTLQPFKWEIDDSAENGACIKCWALDQEDNTHLIRIEDFPITCFIEIPEQICHQIQELISVLKKKLKPFQYHYCEKPKLYFYQNRKYPFLCLLFDSLEDRRFSIRKLRYPVYVRGSKITLKVWEDKIPPIRKFWTEVNLTPAQWFKVKVEEDEEKTFSREFVASWRDIKPLTLKKFSHPKILIYDIETYSRNHKAFPNPDNASDVCYIISVLTQRLGLPETLERRVIVWGPCNPLEDTEIIQVNSEIECIKTFGYLVKELDPDIISGYNIHGFDNSYLDRRLGRVMEEWPEMGRLGEKPDLSSKNWFSNAYGHNEVNILEMSGRISIDLLPVIRRDYKFIFYDLDTVAKHFLKRGKNPVKPVEIFRAFESQDIEQITRVTNYCVWDSEAVLKIAEKIHLWIASVELANIVGVSIMDLYTRGQQVRCLSRIYDEAHRQGYVLDFKDPLNVIFNGGSVEKPEPGVVDEVPCYDFNSLYPTIVIENNIDYTTYLPDQHSEDEKTNLISFDQFERPKKKTDKVSKEDFDLDPEMEEGKLVSRRICFVKKEIKEGIIPKIVRNLIDERKKIKNQLKEETDEVEKIVLDRRQWGLKITANSYFGFLGAIAGRLPLIEAAMAITAKGREMIHYAQDYLREKYNVTIEYGDTDSTMPKFHHIKGWPWKERYAFYKDLEQELSDLFPGRTAMEMEKIMRIIKFAPKMYAAILYDKDGNLILDPNEMLVKGIILARRDGTPFVRKHFKKILFNILEKYSEDPEKDKESLLSSFEMIIEAVDEIKDNRVNFEELAKVNTLGSNYKNKNYALNVLAQHLREIGRPANPGDRLHYLVCELPGNTVGQKLRTVDEFIELELKPDTNYYLENALQKKIDPLFSVGYNRILPLLETFQVGYTPYSLKHFVPISQPVRMMARMLEDKQDIHIHGWLRKHLSYNRKIKIILI